MRIVLLTWEPVPECSQNGICLWVSVKAGLWTVDWTMDWVAIHSMLSYAIRWKCPTPDHGIFPDPTLNGSELCMGTDDTTCTADHALAGNVTSKQH